jgi:hypothetical protein
MWRDVLTSLPLLFGILAWGVGWVAGVVMLWTSPTWWLRDRLVVTPVVPGWVPMAFLIALFGIGPKIGGHHLSHLQQVVQESLQYAIRAAPFIAAGVLARTAVNSRRAVTGTPPTS